MLVHVRRRSPNYGTWSMLGSTQKLVPFMLLWVQAPGRLSPRQSQSPVRRSSLGRHRPNCLMQFARAWRGRSKLTAQAIRAPVSKL